MASPSTQFLPLESPRVPPSALLRWKSVVRSHRLSVEYAAIDIDSYRVFYHMELELETPLPTGALQDAEFLCLTWPYGGLWRIERVLDGNTRVRCLSWRRTELSPSQVDQVAKQVDGLAKQVEADGLTPDLTMPTLFTWKMMRGEWGADCVHWFIRDVRPPVTPATSSSERFFIAKLFVDVDPVEARIDVNAVTAIDTVEQTYAADVTWQVTLPAITALRDDAAVREFLDVLEIDANQFEFVNVTEMQDARPLLSSFSPAGEAQFHDLTLSGDHVSVEDVYHLQFSRRIVATFTEEMTLHSFPFDQQKLIFDFCTGSGMPNDSVHLTPTPVEPGSFSIEDFQLGNVFDVAYHNKVFVSELKETGPRKSIAFEMVLERRSAYYLTNVALIAACITYLTFITWAPLQDGELMDTGSRLQVVTALLLTAVTFKNQVASLIPQVSYFTTLDKYVFFCFIVTCLVTLENSFFPLIDDLLPSENGLLGISWGLFTVVNIIWAMYLRHWLNRRRYAAQVLAQVHEYVRAISTVIPPKYRDEVLNKYLKETDFPNWSLPKFLTTSNGDVHIQAPDDAPEEDHTVRDAKTKAFHKKMEHAFDEVPKFMKIYSAIRPGLAHSGSVPVTRSIAPSNSRRSFSAYEGEKLPPPQVQRQLSLATPKAKSPARQRPHSTNIYDSIGPTDSFHRVSDTSGDVKEL